MLFHYKYVTFSFTNFWICRNKLEVNQMIKTMSDHEFRPFNLSFVIDIEFGATGKKEKVSYAVCHALGKQPECKELQNWSENQALIPWVAVASRLPVRFLMPF